MAFPGTAACNKKVADQHLPSLLTAKQPCLMKGTLFNRSMIWLVLLLLSTCAPYAIASSSTVRLFAEMSGEAFCHRQDTLACVYAICILMVNISTWI
eukprot:scaffold76371_cov18-Tisochrysis_lutea.AAC.1